MLGSALGAPTECMNLPFSVWQHLLSLSNSSRVQCLHCLDFSQHEIKRSNPRATYRDTCAQNNEQAEAALNATHAIPLCKDQVFIRYSVLVRLRWCCPCLCRYSHHRPTAGSRSSMQQLRSALPYFAPLLVTTPGAWQELCGGVTTT